jgi:uncharacterized protein
VLTYNVAELLRSAPGARRDYDVDVHDLRIAQDVRLVAPIEGQLQLSRTGRSVLARAELSTAIEGVCGRCLKPVVAPIEVSLEEEALPSIDIHSGAPLDQAAEPDALRLDEHHELHLAEPVREAIALAEPTRLLCRPDCAGLCPVCGADLNLEPSHRHVDDDIDPRLAGLAEWRANNDDEGE